MVVCAGLPRAEMEDLGRVVGLSRREIELVSSWSSPPGWASAGANEEPPGRGRFLIKVGGRPGIPIKVAITDTERELHNTNTRWTSNGYAEERAAERAAAKAAAFAAGPGPALEDLGPAADLSRPAADLSDPSGEVDRMSGKPGGLHGSDLAPWAIVAVAAVNLVLFGVTWLGGTAGRGG